MSKEVKKTKSVKEDEKVTDKKANKENETKKSSVKKNNKPLKKSSPKKVLKKETITLEEADSFYHISLLAQAVCVIGILFISILAIFEHSFTVPIEVLVGITLLIMAYNNERVFVRRGLTVVYLIFGIVCLLVGVLGYFGVNA